MSGAIKIPSPASDAPITFMPKGCVDSEDVRPRNAALAGEIPALGLGPHLASDFIHLKRWQIRIAEPLLERLSRYWEDEARVLEGLSYPAMRLFWAQNLGLIDRRRPWFSRRIMIRLSREGAPMAKPPEKVIRNVGAGDVAFVLILMILGGCMLFAGYLISRLAQ